MRDALESRLLSLKINATISYWLGNSNRLKIKRFIKNVINKDQFLIKFIGSGKVTSKWSKEAPFIKTREELKKDAAKEEYKNLIFQCWSITEEDWTKKRARATNP